MNVASKFSGIVAVALSVLTIVSAATAEYSVGSDRIYIDHIRLTKRMP